MSVHCMSKQIACKLFFTWIQTCVLHNSLDLLFIKGVATVEKSFPIVEPFRSLSMTKGKFTFVKPTTKALPTGSETTPTPLVSILMSFALHFV